MLTIIKKLEEQCLTIKKTCQCIFKINFLSIIFILSFVYIFFYGYLITTKQYNFPIQTFMLSVGLGQKLGGAHKVQAKPTPTPKPSPTPTPTP